LTHEELQVAEAARSVLDILCDAARNVQGIVRAEFRLATAEIREDLSACQSSLRLLGIGILSAIFAAFFALLALVYALTYAFPAWIAALLVAFGLAVCAALMVSAGSRRLKRLNATRRMAGQFEESLE
jgi:uncharacterized membrane protein YqjE